jgi:hypothetical protein
MHGIFTCFALIVYIGCYKVAKVDIKGVYIQTELTGSPIYMKMDKKITVEVISILPKLHPFVTPKGTFYTKIIIEHCVGASSPVDCGMNN